MHSIRILLAALSLAFACSARAMPIVVNLAPDGTSSLLKKSLIVRMGATAGLSSSVFSGDLCTAGQASSGTRLIQRAAGANGYLEDRNNDGVFAAPDDAAVTGVIDPSSVWIRAGDTTPTRPHRAGVVEFELPAGSSTGDFFISEGSLSLSLVGTVTTGGAFDTEFIDIPIDALNTTGDHVHLTQLFGSGADPRLTLSFVRVPEPAGSLLMLLGILGGAVCRRLDMFS